MVGGYHKQETARRANQKCQRRQKRNVPSALRLRHRNGRKTHFAGERRNRAYRKTYLRNARKRFNAEKDCRRSERRKSFNAQRLQNFHYGNKRRKGLSIQMDIKSKI